jgi:hypothetical protein
MAKRGHLGNRGIRISGLWRFDFEPAGVVL